MASSSSLDPSERNFNVFVSFRGKDTGKSFTCSLLESLQQKNIATFFNERHPDCPLSFVLESIEKAKISIVVFSKNYTNSTWCLEELSKIIQCRKTLNQMVIPIFYKVKKSDVENLRGSFGFLFLRQFVKGDFPKYEPWKEALKTACNIPGYVLPGEMMERDVIENITLRIVDMWSSKELEELLRFDDANCVRTIGVLGVAGIGKTTIADIVFKRNYLHFDGYCFLHDIGNDSKQYGLEHVRRKLVCKLSVMETGDEFRAHVRWEETLRNKKFFIVLDNVTEENQINFLIREKEIYRKGSRIVITTRDKNLLSKNTDAIFVVSRLNESKVELLADAYSGDIYPTEEIMDRNNYFYLNNSENLVRILALLNDSQPSDADIVGLWGMAGIGKTSIAREIFGILAPQYDLCYFLQDFYLICQKKGLRQMRDEFYSKVFGGEKLSICASHVKASFMRDWFLNKTILIVLDDVSNSRDAEYVVGGFGWFSRGHRIIITSRRKQVLVQCKVKEPYEINKLSEFESIRLCKQVFNRENEGIISELGNCSSGIPLALKFLISSVSKQKIENMKEHLQSLRINPPDEIREAFRRSFDELDGNEKNIFLDLACFFRGENKDHVVQLLDACGFFTSLGICDLVGESLISLMDNKIEIPIPFQDMGRFIVSEEDTDPCNRSRLWDSKDIIGVLTNNTGTEAIEGIFLDMCDLACDWSPTVFCEMDRLRLLKLYCSTSGNQCKLNLHDGLDILPDELRLLHWEHYPLKCLPQNFDPENLVEINMPYSNLEKLWEGNKNLEKLKFIKLSHSTILTDILVLSDALNLEHIDLEGCTSLIDISTSIPRCGKLVSLNLKDCSRLRSLPSMVDLTYLKILNLSGCSELGGVQDFAPNLKELYIGGTAIPKDSLSISNLVESLKLVILSTT